MCPTWFADYVLVPAFGDGALRYGGVLAISDDFFGDFPRVLATWYHFPGNFHRYVLSFRLGVPILDPFLEDAAMASPKRHAGAFFGVGNTSQVYQPSVDDTTTMIL